MSLSQFIGQLKSSPESIEFDQVMGVIAEHYDYIPVRFTNGSGENTVVNEAGTNEGSCRIFAFARLNKFSEAETLACFGTYYRDEVLGDPDGDSHGNIRSFMIHGWPGIQFDGEALSTS